MRVSERMRRRRRVGDMGSEDVCGWVGGSSIVDIAMGWL